MKSGPSPWRGNLAERRVDTPLSRKIYHFKARDKELELGRFTRIMGVVNLTPDSFYDGGRHRNAAEAVDYCFALAEAGADLLDLGGESSRPGADPVTAAEEIDRVLPVLEAIRGELDLPLSIDTCKAEVARSALEAGADLVNDISALRADPEIGALVAREQAGLVLMHMRGRPKTMQKIPPSADILEEIQGDLQSALQTAYAQQIQSDRIILDPGIGFGKTLEDNLRILNRLAFLERFDLPLLVGTSRKSFIGELLDVPPGGRLLGTAASVAGAIVRGAHMVRVHDVAEMRSVVRVVDALLCERK